MSRFTDRGRIASRRRHDPVELAPPSPSTEAVARSLLDDLLDSPLHSPEFQTRLTRLTRLGERSLQQTGDSVDRTLQRKAAALSGGDDPAVGPSRTLTELQQILTGLDPARDDATGTRRTFRFTPGSRRRQRHLEDDEPAQVRLAAVIRSLQDGQDALRQDNAALQTERDALGQSLGRLTDDAVLVRTLADGIEQRIAVLRRQGKSDDADTLESDALLSLRRRHQDLTTQLAVATQGYLALDVVEKSNRELVAGVDRALDAAVAALRIAVLASSERSERPISPAASVSAAAADAGRI